MSQTVLAESHLPIAGPPVPLLVAFDDIVLTAMRENNVTAAQLGVMREGVVIFQRSYGWQDKALSRPLAPDALMRVASVTKPFTAAAIRALIDQGRLSLTDSIFNPGVPGAGILPHTPFLLPGRTADARLNQITIEHCLTHTGGWDRDRAGDISYMEAKTAAEMGIASPPDPVSKAQWMMGQPLQHDPGTTFAYSNVGFLFLGLVIEEISKQDYLTFLRENVTRAIGIPDAELDLARSLIERQNPREAYYSAPASGPNIFYPAFSDQPEVERPYGSFAIENRAGSGAIITNVRQMLAFAQRFKVSGDNIGMPITGPVNLGKDGGFAGTSSFLRQRADGINIAVICNRAADGLATKISGSIASLINGGQITAWPTNDPYEHLPIAPRLQMDPTAPLLHITTEAGRFYQLFRSTDIESWPEWEVPFVGDGLEKNFPLNPDSSLHSYFKASVK